MSRKERTLVVLKPNCLFRGLVGETIKRFEVKGLQIIGLKMVSPSREMLERLYSVHKGKPFFEELIEFMMTGPLIAMVLEGPSCIEVTRNLVGATDFLRAQAGTIRGDYSLSTMKNLIHACDSQEAAEREIPIIFKEEELHEWRSPLSASLR